MTRRDEPFGAVDELTALSTELCASRLDSRVSASDFSALLTLIIETARSQGYRTGVMVGREDLTPKEEPNPIPLRVINREELLNSHQRRDPDAELRAEVKRRREEAAREPEKPLNGADREKKKPGPKRTPEETRAEIRRRHRAASNGGMHRVPRGFVSSLCREFGISPPTLYNILKEEK